MLERKIWKTCLTSVEGVEIVELGGLFTAEPKWMEAEIGHLQYKPAVDNAIWTFQVAMTTNVRAVYVAHCLRHIHPNDVIIVVIIIILLVGFGSVVVIGVITHNSDC